MQGRPIESATVLLSQSTRRLISWVALLAIVMAALAPTVSRALGPDAAAAWVEICTAQGSRWVAAADQGDAGSSDAGHAGEHCPYCSLHLPVLGTPPAATPVLVLPALAHAVPAAFLAAPRTLHAWVVAQPRAPPAFS